jgi:hypothetical protein
METSDSKKDLLSFTLTVPSNIAINPNKSNISHGRLFITDSGNDRILKFIQNNRFIERWGSSGSDNENSKFPSSVAVDFSGNVFVTD